jgi:hypothetical protein
MRDKGIETGKPIYPTWWFRDTRLQI